MRIRLQDGRVFEGTPKQIVQSMKSIAIGAPRMTLVEYVDWVVRRAFGSDASELQGVDSTDDERCEALVALMVARGFAELT